MFDMTTTSKRMLDYYPYVIKTIQEFKAITLTEGVELEEVHGKFQTITDNAYLTTMDEKRITEWEQILGIVPIQGSTVDDRRETVVARIKGQGKLNTALINAIVHTFTGGSAESWVKDSTLYVEITPPPNNKQYQFANVEQELSKKVPAHLNFKISRNYFTWGDINDNFDTWGDVYTTLGDWESVYLFVPFE
jgi:hypothetical protein